MKKDQSYKWPAGVMPPEGIKMALNMKGLTIQDLALRIENVSISTVRDTIKGISHNQRVLQYLTDLGINHGRTDRAVKLEKVGDGIAA